MDGAVTSFDQFCLPDMILERMQNFLPKHRKSRKGGRPRKDLRRVADANFYRMRTGCQWKAVPPSLCPGKHSLQLLQATGRQSSFSAALEAGLGRIR